MSTIASAKALVVDDSSFARTILKDILRDTGFSVIYEAKDGKEAVEVFVRHKPDLVTMDIIMPRSDGLQALKEIIQIEPKANVIMVSAVGQEHVVEEAIRLGAKGFVVKPFATSKITELVKRIFGLR